MITHQGRALTMDEARDMLKKWTGRSGIALESWLALNFSWPPGVTEEELRRRWKGRSPTRRVSISPLPPRRRRKPYTVFVEDEPKDEPQMEQEEVPLR